MGDRYVIAASVSLGLAFFVGLGVYGVGENGTKVLLMMLGINEDMSYTISKVIFGLLASATAFLMTLAWRGEQEGRIVSSEEVREMIQGFDDENKSGEDHYPPRAGAGK